MPLVTIVDSEGKADDTYYPHGCTIKKLVSLRSLDVTSEAILVHMRKILNCGEFLGLSPFIVQPNSQRKVLDNEMLFVFDRPISTPTAPTSSQHGETE